MNRQVAKRLHDAVGAASRIIDFTNGITIEEFSSDEMRQSATLYAFTILGEALGAAIRDEPKLDQMIPNARRAIGMRHRLVHGYSEVDLEIVWSTATLEVPGMLDDLNTLLENYPRSP